MNEQHPNVPQAHPLKFRTVVRGHGGPKEAVNDVIDDAEELEDYAQACTGEEDRERVAGAKPRFEREKVIAVALGQTPTPAWEVEIVSCVQITGGFVGLQTQVSYVRKVPRAPQTPPDALVAPAYPHHAVRVKNAGGIVIFRDLTPAERPTTLAVGEEEPRPTTLAVGEEEPHYTTLAVGEEGATTLAVGEEGPGPTTLAVGEEGPGPTTLAIGEEGPGGTTMAIGEEGPSTRAMGEEGPGPTTYMFGEEGPMATTLAVGEEDRRGAEDPTTLATGEEGGGDPTTLATGEESRGGWGGGGWGGGGWGRGGGGGGPFGGW